MRGCHQGNRSRFSLLCTPEDHFLLQELLVFLWILGSRKRKQISRSRCFSPLCKNTFTNQLHWFDISQHCISLSAARFSMAQVSHENVSHRGKKTIQIYIRLAERRSYQLKVWEGNWIRKRCWGDSYCREKSWARFWKASPFNDVRAETEQMKTWIV